MHVTRMVSAMALLSLTATACGDLDMPTDPAEPPVALAGGPPAGKGGDKVSDVRTDWTIADPSTDRTVPGLYSDGMGRYEDGRCGVSSVLFIVSGSGGSDLDLTQPKGKDKCGPRSYTLVFPDSATEALPTRSTLGRLHVFDLLDPNDPTHGVLRIVSERCGILQFGVGPRGGGGYSDRLRIVEERSGNPVTGEGQIWRLTSDEDNNGPDVDEDGDGIRDPDGVLALCQNDPDTEEDDVYYAMAVDLTIEARRYAALP